MKNPQPEWAGSYDAVELDGEWFVPFMHERSARKALEELQEPTGPRLEVVPVKYGWDVKVADA